MGQRRHPKAAGVFSVSQTGEKHTAFWEDFLPTVKSVLFVSQVADSRQMQSKAAQNMAKKEIAQVTCLKT